MNDSRSSFSLIPIEFNNPEGGRLIKEISSKLFLGLSYDCIIYTIEIGFKNGKKYDITKEEVKYYSL